MKLGHVALDGTKVKANASKHKAMSYGRMKEREAQLTAEVAELLERAQATDDEEDRWYGKDKRGDELPEELAFREGRLEKIREAMAALEAEAQAAAEQAEAEGGKRPGVPDDKAQRNFTDTESRIIPAPGGKDFLQGYNCQAVVDSAHQVIVAARATNQTSDKQQAAAMMEETIVPPPPCRPLKDVSWLGTTRHPAPRSVVSRRIKLIGSAMIDLHGPQPAQTVPLWGQSAQESTGRWASPTHQELLPR